MTAIDRARADLRRGQPWLARDRLLSVLRDEPCDQAVLRALAGAYAALGDLPAAGACWFLTDADDADPAAAAGLAALRGRYRNAIGIAHAVRVRCGVAAYPPAARGRILDLQEELAALDWTWTPPSRPTPPPDRPPSHPHRQDAIYASLGILWPAFAVANLAVYAVGMIALLRWIW